MLQSHKYHICRILYSQKIIDRRIIYKEQWANGLSLLDAVQLAELFNP